MPEPAPQYTIVPVILVIGCVLWFATLLLPSLNTGDRRNANQMKNSANLRGFAQSMTVFANSNNDKFPGLNPNGDILSGPNVQAHGNAQSGASFHARSWVLLNGSFVGGDLLINPHDSLTKWITGQNCTSLNSSYAGLQIGNGPNALTTTDNTNRAGEWANNANSQSILISDRLLIPTDTADTAVQSLWTTTTGDWKGNVLWGDVHAGFEQSQKGFTTRYISATNTNDNLFITQSTAVATENPTVDASGNAMLIYY